MATSKEYIRRYGDKSFLELPFNDVDNISLCETFYMPFENVVSESFEDEPISYKDACNRLFKFNGNRHIAPGLILMRKISVKMLEMGNTKRFGELKVVACVSKFSVEPPLQFGAMTYIMPNGTLIVVYRGTDDSLIGWKEDMDLYTRKSIPSHKLAVDYLEQVAKHFSGDIIICGHSKGGNVALHAALRCSESTRKRIIRLYNNDGPGFVKGDFINSKEYKELLPNYRHFVPSNSLVGMLLAHDNDFTAVNCQHFLGFLQHDLDAWKTKGTDLYLKDDISKIAKITDEFLKEMIYRVNDDQGVLIDKWFADLITGSGQDNLINISRNLISSVKGVKNVNRNLDSDTRAAVDNFIGGLGKIAVNSVKVVVKGAEVIAEDSIEKIAGAVLA